MDPTIAGALSGAITGGVVSAMANHFISRPRPSGRILDLSINPHQSADKEAIAEEVLRSSVRSFFSTPLDIFEVIQANGYVQKVDRHYVHSSGYTYDLYRVLRDNTAASLINQGMPDILREIRVCLNNNLWGDLIRKWAQYHVPMNGQLFTMFIQENFSLPPAAPPPPNSEPPHKISIDTDGDFFINVGNLRLPFVWSSDTVHGTRLKPYFEQISNALAWENAPTVLRILDALEKVQWGDEIIAKTDKVVSAELARFDLLVARGVITNSGRSGLALEGACQLSVSSSGFQKKGHKVGRDLTIDMHCVDEGRLRPLPTLQIMGGSVTPFVAVSKTPLIELAHGDDIRAVFGGERMARLTWARMDNSKVLQSNLVLFQ